MATQSFFQDTILTTKEEVDRLVEAFEIADRRGPIDTSGAHKVIRDPAEARRIALGLDETDPNSD